MAGHRTFLVDGSSSRCRIPQTPRVLWPTSRAATRGCGFPVAHLLAFISCRDRVPHGDRSGSAHARYGRVTAMHPTLQPGDVLVGIARFCSFAHLALLRQQQLHALFRIHQKQIGRFTPGSSPHHAQPQAVQKGPATLPWLRQRRDRSARRVGEARAPTRTPTRVDDARAGLPRSCGALRPRTALPRRPGGFSDAHR